MKCYSHNIFFETISSRTRLNIIELLMNGSMNVTQICSALNQEQSKISHNLKHLTDCHFLNVEKKGKHRIYSLNKETIVPLMNLVEKHVEKYCKDICKKKENAT